MGNLVGISLVGIDKNTDILELQRLQEIDSRIEFGVIMSKNWQENGNRYWDPKDLPKLRGKGLNLSLHLCGSAARAAIHNDWSLTEDLLDENFALFNRVQLNIASNGLNPKNLDLSLPADVKEIVIQQKAAYDCALFYNWFLKHPEDKSITVLLDGSGGLGIETEIIPLINAPKVGYAGGFGPENVYSKTSDLLLSRIVKDFWIDMESKLRTNDWFDIKKAELIINLAIKAEKDLKN